MGKKQARGSQMRRRLCASDQWRQDVPWPGSHFVRAYRVRCHGGQLLETRPCDLWSLGTVYTVSLASSKQAS